MFDRKDYDTHMAGILEPKQISQIYAFHKEAITEKRKKEKRAPQTAIISEEE